MRSRMRRARIGCGWLIAAMVATSVTGCGTAPSDAPIAASAPRTVTKVRCPVMKDYPRDQMARAADELAAMQPGSVVPGLIADYQKMRDETRALCGT